MTDTVLLRCLKSGCPRKKRVPRDVCRDLPEIVVEIQSFCPWHAKEGWKAYPEIWFDAQGRTIDEVTGKPL